MKRFAFTSTSKQQRLTRLMSSLLFGISPLDPVTYLAVSVVLIAAAAIASYIPAHRAITVDPVKALRAQ